MKVTSEIHKVATYITYEYDSIDEKESHILKMGEAGYECLDRFEDDKKAMFRKIETTTVKP